MQLKAEPDVDQHQRAGDQHGGDRVHDQVTARNGADAIGGCDLRVGIGRLDGLFDVGADLIFTIRIVGIRETHQRFGLFAGTGDGQRDVLLGEALVHKRLGDHGGIEVLMHRDGHHGAAGKINAKVHAAANDADDQTDDQHRSGQKNGKLEILGEFHYAFPSFALTSFTP